MLMDRLDSPACLMIVSDLDNTMVDHKDPGNLSLLRFNALWEAYYRHNSLLVFSTGRSCIRYKELRKEKPLLTPDITIMSVGTEIMYGEAMVPDEHWEKYLDQKWDRSIVTEETAKFPQLKFQEESEQRPYKISFYIEKDEAEEVMTVLSQRLKNRGLDVKIIYSGGEALDILPQGAGKGQALAYLLKLLTVDGKRPVNTLVCGDSGNDAELFSIPEVHGVMVSNAMEELLQWYTENAKNNPKIIHASERCASGIIQTIGHFKLGLDKSPRDVMDFSEDKIGTSHPGNEVVKFYLFFERWRRAEVENTEHHLQNLREVSHPSGIFVHPSGVEQPLHNCIDAMQKCYGDKQGTHFRIWVDRVSAAQIGSDAWLVKFDKWESSVGWWSNYGNHTPNLQKVAMRILSLTTSSSGCERNWSVFEGIHTKKRNRLDTERMNKLVYVQFNARLMNKKKRKSDRVDTLLANTAHNAQSWMVDGLEDEEVTPGSGLTWGMVGEALGANEELQPRRSARNLEEVRESEEDDFVSDGTEDEGDDDEEFDFESDKERDVGHEDFGNENELEDWA